MDWFTLANELTPAIRCGDTSTAITRVSEVIRTMPSSPYHLVLDLNFTNSRQSIARQFEQFISDQKNRSKIKAVYAEMNGFFINPGLWYFNLFAYDQNKGHEDYDWLATLGSEPSPKFVLTGMEELQKIYKYYRYLENPRYEARDFCDLLVVCKFQDLLKRSIPYVHEFHEPVLATAHDYDFIAEFNR